MPTTDVEVKGTITNTGGTTGGTGFISLSGSATQSLQGNFGKIKVNNTSGVNLSGATTITEVLDIDNGTLTTNGNLTLASTSASQCACLDDMSSGGTITGNITIERTLPAGNKRYFYAGTPVKSQTLGNWQDDLT